MYIVSVDYVSYVNIIYGNHKVLCITYNTYCVQQSLLALLSILVRSAQSVVNEPKKKSHVLSDGTKEWEACNQGSKDSQKRGMHSCCALNLPYILVVQLHCLMSFCTNDFSTVMGAHDVLIDELTSSKENDTQCCCWLPVR